MPNIVFLTKNSWYSHTLNIFWCSRCHTLSYKFTSNDWVNEIIAIIIINSLLRLREIPNKTILLHLLISNLYKLLFIHSYYIYIVCFGVKIFMHNLCIASVQIIERLRLHMKIALMKQQIINNRCIQRKISE